MIIEHMDVQAVPYSSIVGGGVMFTDKKTGRALFQIGIMGLGNGINKDQTEYMVKRIIEGWKKTEPDHA